MSQFRCSDSEVARYFGGLAEQWNDRYRNDPSFAERLGRFGAAIADLPPGSDVLDFGCGTGDIARHLLAHGYHVTGLDRSEEMIAICKERHAGSGLCFTCHADPGSLPFPSASFDVVIASSVLEYVRELDPLLREIRRILRPGGRLVFTVPDIRHPIRRREAWLRRLVKMPGLSMLVLHSRWADGARYLALSVNRQPVSAWLAMLAKAGFAHDQSPPPCEGPLIMLSGRADA